MHIAVILLLFDYLQWPKEKNKENVLQNATQIELHESRVSLGAPKGYAFFVPLVPHILC